MFHRLNNYIDSFYEFVEFHLSDSLPSLRRLSVKFVKDEHSPDDLKTMAYWTIFVVHDLSYTAISRMMNSNKSMSFCSNRRKELMPRNMNELCIQVVIPGEDPISEAIFVI